MKKPLLLLFIIFFWFLPPAQAENVWSTMTSGTTNDLRGVWGSSGTDVFAVGESGTILHYDGSGSNWSSMLYGWTDMDFMGVWGSSGTDVFAVEWNGDILHYAKAQNA